MKMPFYFKREVRETELLKAIATPIELFGIPEPFRIPWPSDEKSISISRPQDDHDGDISQRLEILMSMDQDIRMRFHPEFANGCYRDMSEGTASPRTGCALKLVWYACYLHNSDMARTIMKRFSEPASLRTIFRILETRWFPASKGLSRENWYQTCSHDHNDGHDTERMCLFMGTHGSRVGDMFIETTAQDNTRRSGYLHYRSAEAGGSRPLVYNALRILALAMHLDNTLNYRFLHRV